MVAVNPTIARVAVSGLESGLVLAVGVAILAMASSVGGGLVEGRTQRWRIGMGVLLALAFLSRTDSILLVGAVALAVFFEAHPGRGRTEHLRRAAPVLVIPAVTAAVYLVSNRVIFGTWMQISGEIKRRSLTPTLVLVAALVAVVVVVAIRAGATSSGPPVDESSRLVRTRCFAAATMFYGAFCLAIVVYYVVFQVQIWLWYFAPLVAWGSVLLVLFVTDLIESAIVEAPAERTAGRVVAPLAALLGLPLVAGLAMQWQSFTDPDIRSIQLANRRAAEWTNQELPRGTVLASWDAGVLGYFSDHPVVNLDGVVNSKQWFEATQDGPDAVAAFLDRSGVDYIVNHGRSVNGADPSVVRYVTKVFGPERARGLRLIHTVPFSYSGNTVGSDGAGGGGAMAVFVYRIPPADP